MPSEFGILHEFPRCAGQTEAEARSNLLPDEDAARGCHRDGTARTGLQSHPRDEHHRRLLLAVMTDR
jgi:hypothetical protein